MRDTSCGSKAALAGQRNVRAAPATNRQKYVHKTGARRVEINVKPALDKPMTSTMRRRICLRLWLSAACPAGSVSSTIGAICVKPTNPSARAECVRSYNSQPTATVSICCPTEAMKRPIKFNKKSRSRSTS